MSDQRSETTLTGSSAGSAQATVAMVIIALARFMVVLDGTIMIVSLPSIDRSLHISAADLNWVLNAYALTFGGFLLVAGRVGDALGRKNVFRAGLILFGVASLFGGLSGSGTELIIARAVQGIGAAIATPGALSLLVSTFPDEKRRTRALGIYGAATGLAALMGLLLGGVLTTYANWRWVLFVNIPVVLAILVGLGVLREGARVRIKIDLPGAVSSTLGIGALVYAVDRAGDRGWGNTFTIVFLLVGVALLAVFAVVQRVSAEPMIPRQVIADPGRIGANIVTFLYYSGSVATYFFLTLNCQQVLNYSAIRTGLVFLPLAIGFGIAAGIAPQLKARTSERAALSIGLGIVALGSVMFSLLTPHSSIWTLVFPASVATGIGLGITAVISTGIGVRGIDDSEAGVGSALLTASSQVGSALGLAVLATIATTATRHAAAMTSPKDALTEGYSAGFLAAAGLYVLCIIIALVVIKPMNPPATARSPLEAGRELDSQS
ncbi:MFS transporter [Nocardia sp. NBC_00511]|uniref:MFS transporter n=1 Tax=Nocardia sp. NBC_00511 TaxID=2903591 RepID=UPI0030DF20D5